MKHESRFLGTVEYSPDDVYYFPNGVAGYPEHRRFLLMEPEATSPAVWLVCLDEGGPELALIDPQLVGGSPRADHELRGAAALKRIRAHATDDVKMLCVLTVPDQIRKTSINMRAPILLNLARRLGTQVGTEDMERRPLRRYVYADLLMSDDPNERSGMVITHRKVDETLEIGPEITVRVLEIADGGVRLGVSAPRRVSVTRGTCPITVAGENRRASDETNAECLVSLMRVYRAGIGQDVDAVLRQPKAATG